MLYRLLRNNKESGPFTALQLKEMGLKPYDLLWSEGRGAAWQYASELSELKDFAPVVEEQPFERFAKRKEVLEPAAVATKKVKPRYRISNGQLIMVEAGSMEVGTNGVIKETTPVRTINPVEAVPVENKIAEQNDWQSFYPQWQPQQQPKKEAKAAAGEPVEIETKYSESLDDLKKRYAEKVLGDKPVSSSSASLSSASMKQNIMAILALVVLVAGGYIGYTLKKKDDTSVTSGQASVERADIAGNNNSTAQPADNNVASDDNGTVSAGDNDKATVNAKPESNRNIVTTAANTSSQNTGRTTVAPLVKDNGSKTAASTAQKKMHEAVVKTSTVQPDKSVVKTTAKPDNSAAAKTSSASEKSNTASVASLPAPTVTKPAAKQIGDYVSLKKLGGSGTGVQNVKLMVSNVSDFPIDLAVVDIQYYDSKGKFQKGETMYVKDINGGNNVEVRVPDSEKASSIKYKVSMVQADQKTLYMVAD